MKLGMAVREVADAERKLADALWRVGERHRTDHDVFHVTKTLAKQEREHVARLEQHARRDGDSAGDSESDSDDRGVVGTAIGRGSSLVDRAMGKGSELVGRRPEPALMLLRDLRHLHELAARASIEWTILGQGAQAARDQELLAVVTNCHDETLRTLKWTTYRIKEAAPQILAT